MSVWKILEMAPVGVSPWYLGYTSGAYGIIAAALAAGFIWQAWKVLVAPRDDRRAARALFAYSILYLFAIFAALLVDTIVTRVIAAAA